MCDKQKTKKNAWNDKNFILSPTDKIFSDIFIDSVPSTYRLYIENWKHHENDGINRVQHIKVTASNWVSIPLRLSPSLLLVTSRNALAKQSKRILYARTYQSEKSCEFFFIKFTRTFVPRIKTNKKRKKTEKINYIQRWEYTDWLTDWFWVKILNKTKPNWNTALTSLGTCWNWIEMLSISAHISYVFLFLSCCCRCFGGGGFHHRHPVHSNKWNVIACKCFSFSF